MVDSFKFEQVISIGVDCRVSFQASRFFGGSPAIPPPVQSGGIEPEMPPSIVGKHLFDWNIVWFADVIRMFDDEFEDLFDKALLRPMPNDANVAIDGKFGIRYFHSFRAAPGQSFADMIEDQYADVAPKIFYLRDKLKAHLQTSCPTLYVRCDGSEAEAARFCETVKARYPAHCFHLLLVDMKEETSGFTVRRPDYSIYQMAKHVRKPAGAVWTGDDEEWTDMFRLVCASLAPAAVRSIAKVSLGGSPTRVGKILAALQIPRGVASRGAKAQSGQPG